MFSLLYYLHILAYPCTFVKHYFSEIFEIIYPQMREYIMG